MRLWRGHPRCIFDVNDFIVNILVVCPHIFNPSMAIKLDIVEKGINITDSRVVTSLQIASITLRAQAFFKIVDCPLG